MRSLHARRTHPIPVDGCFGCKLAAVQVGASATPTRRDSGYGVLRRFADEDRRGDRDAYVRLRRQGLQPPHIAGSARLERDASTAFEVATGVIYDREHARQLQDALDICQEGHLDPLTPYTAPKWDERDQAAAEKADAGGDTP